MSSQQHHQLPTGIELTIWTILLLLQLVLWCCGDTIPYNSYFEVIYCLFWYNTVPSCCAACCESIPAYTMSSSSATVSATSAGAAGATASLPPKGDVKTAPAKPAQLVHINDWTRHARTLKPSNKVKPCKFLITNWYHCVA
jgi:hypothetical protein